MKVEAQGITRTITIGPLFTKRTRQNGNKGQEGGADIHNRAGTQQDTGETRKASCLMWEKDEEVKNKDNTREETIKIKQEMN